MQGAPFRPTLICGIVIGLVLLTCSVPLRAQPGAIIQAPIVQANPTFVEPLFDTTFCVTQTDQEFLTYYYAENRFDSIAAAYRIGEITVRNKDSVVRVFPASQLQAMVTLQESSNGVHQVRLDSFMRWTTITMPPNAELRFLRNAMVPSYDHDRGWYIEDRTVFKFEARDPVSNDVLWVVDSIMIDSGRTAIEVEPSGTSVNLAYVRLKVPERLSGKRVMFAVRIERHGKSPFGLEARREASVYGLSMQYTANGMYRLDQDEVWLLELKRDQYWMQYAEYCYAATGMLPNRHGFSYSAGFGDTVNTRFFDVYSRNDLGRTYMKLRQNTPNPNVQYGPVPITIDDKVVGGCVALSTFITEVDVDGYDIEVELERYSIPSAYSMTVLHSGGLEQGSRVYKVIPVGDTTIRFQVEKGTPKPWVISGRNLKGRAVFAFTVP